jgi:cysteine desulfurase
MECGKLWGNRLIKIPFKKCEIDLKFIEEELKKGDIAIVSVMALNNETGLFLSIKEIAKLIKKHSPDTIFHVDGVQAFGKIEISLRENFIDYLTFSAHKIGGLKGCGGLISQREIKKEIIPLVAGGGQEFGLRSGTENILSIISLDLAMDYWEKNRNLLHDKFLKCSSKLNDLLKKDTKFLIVWKDSPNFANWIFTFSIDSVVTPAVIVRMLSDEGIFISSGSACHSGQIPMNSTLLELGFSEIMAKSMLRVSFGWDTKIEDIEMFYESLEKIIEKMKIEN